MTKKLIKELAKDPNHIEGIYNYCDRWCERCAFTSRCLNYKIYEERFGDLKDKDIQNKEFWQRFNEMMRETMEMIKESMQERGFDIEDLTGDDDSDINTDDQFLIILSGDYAMKVTKWFDEPYYIDEETANDLEKNHQQIEEIIEIIHWYQYQIEVKLTRAFYSKDMDDEISVKDMNGSAKVALIGIDRSIGAWGQLLQFFPEREKSILELLNLLERILTITENTFPAARSFIRPGFDEIKIS
ncbi:MAG: hypothetical protein B1H05_01135 [Candidatus Cloacimonas sp. 4484_140]|nr:MAG: hypothetical protein B1H05_01135 [Candidatus Cloacimonas sp. 4484_140]